MKAKDNVLCKLFDHKWQVNNMYEPNIKQKFPPYNILRICKRCNKKEVLVDMPDYKWELITG